MSEVSMLGTLGPIALCILRMERHEHGVLITVSTMDDVTRGIGRPGFATLDLEQALEAVREAAHRITNSQS